MVSYGFSRSYCVTSLSLKGWTQAYRLPSGLTGAGPGCGKSVGLGGAQSFALGGTNRLEAEDGVDGAGTG